MSRIVLSPRAKTDLSGIWDDTVGKWGVEQAEAYVRQLWAAMLVNAENPSLSMDIDEVREGYRKAKSGSQVIFVKLSDGGIDVVRILHQRMDLIAPVMPKTA